MISLRMFMASCIGGGRLSIFVVHMVHGVDIVSEYKGVRRKKRMEFEPSCVFDFLCESYMITRKKMGFGANCVFGMV